MLIDTPFGQLLVSMELSRNRVMAILRALDWCDTIVKGSLWRKSSREGFVSLTQTINGQFLEVFPLRAASLDAGNPTLFQRNHLPINLNGRSACVRSHSATRPRPLHADMVASMLLLLGSADFDPFQVPLTLKPILTEEQQALLPPRQINNHLHAPRLETHPLECNDEEARQFFQEQPAADLSHHARRLSATRHQSTLRWVLLHLAAEETDAYGVSRWMSGRFYSCQHIFTENDIEQFLSHEDQTLRSWAVENLRSTDTEHQMNLLEPMLTDISSAVLHRVMTRIRSLSIATQQKLDLFHPVLESQCHVAITHIGHLEIEPSLKLEILQPYLDHANSNIVVGAIRALRHSGDESTEQILISNLNHADDLVVRCLLQSIESFGPWFESKIPLYYERSNLHQALLSALERAEGFSPVPYITHLLNGQRNTIIVRGISTLAKIGCKQAIKTIGNYLLAFKSIYVRRNAAEYLGETGHESALEFLEAALMDASPGVRQSSLRSIAQIHAVQHSW